jgi:dethiobiotin synthetase
MSLPGLLITGTDTGVGKTRVAAAIARCLIEQGQRVGVLKPVATGAEQVEGKWRSGDAEQLIEAIGDLPGLTIERVVPFCYEPPVAPSVAARACGTPLQFKDVVQGVREALDWWAERVDVVIVEGVGGLLCPLAERATVADLAVALDLPVLIVARRGLGTLNHTLLTVEAAKRRSLRVAGIVFNSAERAASTLAENTAADELARHLEDIAILADLSYESDPSLLWERVRDVDWYGWCRASRGPFPPLKCARGS